MSESLKESALVTAISEAIGGVSDLLKKEVRLAEAELSHKVSTKLRAGLWMAITGVLGLFAALAAIEAAIFAIASYGLALHWSCLVVAGILSLGALCAYAIGGADARASITPTRTMRQLRQDGAMAKESYHEGADPRREVEPLALGRGQREP
jgi:hypothetical protein